MVSDGDYQDLLTRVQFLENLIGTLRSNGLDAMVGQSALEFGNSQNRLSAIGYQSKVTSSVTDPPSISSTNSGVLFVKDFTNGATPGYPFAALFGSLITADDAMAATLVSKGNNNDNSEDYVRVYSVPGTDANSYVELAHWGAGLAAFQTLKLNLNGVALSNAWLRLHNDSGDGITGATAADGMIFYRSDLDVLRLRANGAWVSLATANDNAIATPYLLASSGVNVSTISTNTEQTMISVTIPANTIHFTNVYHALRITAGGTYLNNRGGTSTLRLKLKFGGTIYWDDTTAALADDATERAWKLDVIIAANSAGDSVESMFGRFTMSAVAAATVGDGDLQTVDAIDTTFYGAPAKDNTAAQVFAFTAQNSNSDNATKLIQTYYAIEVI
jgi:hypothetical protein